MPDLNVVAVIPANPGSEEAVRAALTKLVGPTREEAGCVSYDLFESAAAPGTFVTVEVWKTQADMDAHMQTPHIAEALGIVVEHVAGSPAIHPLIPVA